MTSTAADLHTIELRREGWAMALYVAICLLAALVALPESQTGHPRVLGVIWGVTLGLALAHWFAFRLSARLVGAPRPPAGEISLIGVQLSAAAAVALLATVPVLLIPEQAEIEVVGFVLAAFLGLVGFTVARGAGASHGRALVHAAVVLVLATAIATLKAVLGGH